MLRTLAPLFAFALALAPRTVLAEGSAELGKQYLSKDTVAWVDILEPAVEVLTWEGMGTLTVSDAAGNVLDTLSSGDSLTFGGLASGAYQVSFSSDQVSTWDIRVEGGSTAGGRLFSTYWNLDSGTWDETGAFSGSFYALVTAGGDSYNGVIEMRAEGLQGHRWQMAANGIGVTGPNAGRSVSEFNNAYASEYPIYLNPPAKALDSVRSPGVTELTFVADDPRCGGVAPGYGGGTFTFRSATPGTYHLTCDLDGDGVYDFSSNTDLTATGYANEGENSVYWDGLDNAGANVEPGTYGCQITVTVGEFHYIAADIETSFPGLRLFRVRKDLSREALKMFWNDTLVVSPDVPMPDGQQSSMSSGATGTASGSYTDDTVPNTNARAWGDFSENGKGNVSLLDTWVWIQDSRSSVLNLRAVDASVDENDDGIPDGCLYGYYYGGCSTAGRGSLWGLLGVLSALLLAGTVVRRWPGQR